MKSKYFIAYLLSGAAKAYHERLTRLLSSQFNIFPLHERVSPHITIKAPFEIEDEYIPDVERVLRSFAHNESVVPLRFEGFGRFGFKTVYLNVVESPEATALIRRAIRVINNNISWMPRNPLEGNKLHASVARFMDRTQFRRVSRFMKEAKPKFHLILDNIALLRKEGSTWKVITVIPFTSETVGKKSEGERALLRA